MWTAFQGDWDTATDLVIQSFVKAYFVDDAAVEVAGRYQWRPGVPQSAILKPRGNTTPTAPFADRFGNFGLSCDPFNAVLYDREENIEVAEVVPTFSPVPNLNNELCFETNVITFNGSFALESPYSWDIQSESFLNGWIDVDLRGDANLYTITGTGGTAAASTVVPGEYYYGLPIMVCRWTASPSPRVLRGVASTKPSSSPVPISVLRTQSPKGGSKRYWTRRISCNSPQDGTLRA